MDQDKTLWKRIKGSIKQPISSASTGLIRNTATGTKDLYTNTKSTLKKQGLKKSFLTTSGRLGVKKTLSSHSPFTSRGDLLTGNFFSSSSKKGLNSIKKEALEHKEKLNALNTQEKKNAYMIQLRKKDNAKTLEDLGKFNANGNEERTLKQLNDHNKRYNILEENNIGEIRNADILNSNTSGFIINFLKIKHGYLELASTPNLVAECKLLNHATGKTMIIYKDVNPVTNLGFLVNNISKSSRKNDSLLIIEMSRTNLAVNRTIYSAIGCYIKPKNRNDPIIAIYFNPIVYKRKNGSINYNYGEPYEIKDKNTNSFKKIEDNTLTNVKNLIKDNSINKLGFLKPIDNNKLYVFIKYDNNNNYINYVIKIKKEQYYLRGIFYKPINTKIIKGFNVEQEKNITKYADLEKTLKESEESYKNVFINVKETVNELNKSLQKSNITLVTSNNNMLKTQIDKKIQNTKQKQQKNIPEIIPQIQKISQNTSQKTSQNSLQKSPKKISQKLSQTPNNLPQLPQQNFEQVRELLTPQQLKKEEQKEEAQQKWDNRYAYIKTHINKGYFWTPKLKNPEFIRPLLPDLKKRTPDEQKKEKQFFNSVEKNIQTQASNGHTQASNGHIQAPNGQEYV
jgi:hypothetical protein